MPEDIQTTVLGVRSEASRDGQSIKHLVSLSGGVAPSGTQYPAGEYTTFQPVTRDKAQGYVNAGPVTARVEIATRPKRNGQGVWINHNIEDIGNDMPAVAMPAVAGTPVEAPQAQAPAPQPVQHPVLAQADDRRSEENRRSALHAASEFVSAQVAVGFHPSAVEANRAFTEIVESMVAFIETGSFTGANTISQQAGNPPTTPQELAASVTGVEVGTDGIQAPGVPFDANTSAVA